MFNVWDEARPDELETGADVAHYVGQDLPDILMNEKDADGDKPHQQLDGRAAENSTEADEVEAMEVFKQFVMYQWSDNVEEVVAAPNLARSTDGKFMRQHMSLFGIPVHCCADTDEVVNK